MAFVGFFRTDTGVSARGQAFHFDLTQEEHDKLVLQYQEKRQQSNDNNQQQSSSSSPSLEYTMNRMLTDEIRVWNVGVAPPRTENITVVNQLGTNASINGRTFDWNAIHESTHKHYCYRICAGPVMDPIHRFQRWHVPADGIVVNTTLLSQTLSHFEGTHDFRPFAGSMEQLEKSAGRRVSAVRTVYKCQLIDESEKYRREGYFRIDIVLSGALYKMVRNMVGTAIDVSRGKLSEDQFLQLLDNGKGDDDDDDSPQLGRKNNKSKPAPPEGLTLEQVFYDDETF